MAELLPIPEPPGMPFFGNAGDVSPTNPTRDMKRLAETYGKHSFGVLATFLGPID